MNKIYKVVWNTVRNCYVVGSELISSKSGRHSTSNGKSSSLKVTLTVLALCGMTALGSGVAPAYAANAGTAVESQYVAVLVNSSNNSRRDYRDFDGYSYHKERIASTGDVYWVRDGYTIKYEADKRYPGARNANIIKAYKTSSYTADSDAGLLKSNQIMIESAGISTLTGVDLDDVSGGTYVGATNSGSTSTPSSFNYMIKDDNGTYIDAGGSNYRTHFAAATKNSDGTYSYNGEVLSNDNLYVISSTDRYGNTTNKVGVFLTSSGKVYTGKVFGANNEVLMTTKSDEGTMYSYWGADTPDPNTKLADMTIGQFNQALEKVNNNSKAVAGDTIKEIKTTAKTEGGTDGGTIDLVRRGQYNSATGQYEGEYTVGDGITITSHGGTNGEDVKINFSNGTTGFDVAAGSKVEAVKATESATDITGLKINGETYNIKTGQTYTAGDNISIKGTEISALNNYVNSATLNDYDELVLTREGLEDLTVDLSQLTRGLSSTDYQLVENKNSSDGKYKVSNGEVTLTVKDMNNLSNKEVKTITISGLAGQEDLTHYFSVDAPMTNPLDPLGNYNNEGAQGERSIAIGVKASATGDFSVAIGSGQNDAGSTASGDYATAVGNGSLAEGADSTALGYNATALGEDSVAIGYTSIANGKNSMALGVEARAGNNESQADYATAVGALAHVDAVDGTALGQNAEVNSERGTALGSTSKVHAAKGTAIGAYTSVTAEGGVAIGQESVADRAAGMKGYNPLGEANNTPTWTATDGAVSLGSDPDGSSPHTRQITNLAAGTADTDAVNVAQLKNTKIAITNEYTKYVTDNENYVTGGSINGDTITLNRVQGGDVTITGLKDYVEGLDSYVTSASLKDNKLTITQNNNKGNYEIDLSGFANQFSGTDYRVVANPAEGSKGIYKPDANGNIALTVQDPKTGATSTVQLSDVASATTVTNNYTTLDTKIDKTKTDITNAYTTTINETKNTITNEYKKYVSDTEDYVTSGSISGDTIKLKRALGGEVAITGLKDYVEGLDSYVTSASLKDNKLTITQNNNKGNYEIDLSDFANQFSGTDYRVVANPAEGSKGIYKPDANGNIALTIQDTKTGATSTVQLSDVASATTVTNNYNTLNTKVDAAKTTLADGKNTTVEASTAEDGHTEYKVNLNEDVKLGDTIQLNGSDGSISATSGTSSLNFNDKGLSLSNGKNSTVINGGTITVNGGESVISGTQATFGKIKLNAESGSTITGLSNTTTHYTGFATAGRAATEEQLKEVAGKAGEAIETAGKGWNLTTNGASDSKTNIAPGGTVDFSSRNDNLLISNAGADLLFSLSDNLDLTKNDAKKGSVKVGENTALSNELLQVGNSSLTTSALMVGSLTYISSSGLNANKRVISNVAAGIADTDAVNVGQLKSAISGSQVSINAGLGIIVEKQGNQYTIKTNIEGVENEHGTIHVTDSDQSLVANSEMVTPAHAKRLNTLMMADMMAVTEATEPEKTTFTGPKAFIQQVSKPVTLTTDDQKSATLNDGETIYFQGDGNIETTTTVDTNRNSDTIKFALKKDIKVDSIEAKSGDQINIKSEVNMNDKKITNLADGEIAEGSTDAVNGGQLYNTNQAVIANAENINSLSHSLNKLDSRINRVGAGAAALAALHPLDFDPDNKWDFAAGYGNYAGANAVAIGTYYRPNENTMFSIGGSFGGGENMINAGVSFKLGSGGSGITTSKTVMAKKIKEQDELLKAQDAKMKEQDEKIAKLEALVAQQGEMIQQALGKK